VESTGRGGAEIALRHLLATLDSAYETIVMGVDASVCRWIAASRPGVVVVLVPAVRGKFSLGAFVRLRRAIARLRPDIFHANLRTMADCQYGIAAALSVPGVHVVVVEQLPFPLDSALARRLKRLTSHRLAGHVAVGEQAARIVEREVGLSRGSIGTIYNGVPDPGPLPAPAPGDAVLVGTLARLDRIKGLDLLLAAAAPLDGVALRLVGEGPEQPALEALARELRIEHRTEFVPWADDARGQLEAMDIFVLPSRNEGFPLSIVEAMLASRPVVATDVGSVSESVGPENGTLVPPEDVEALRAALGRLAADRDLRLRLGDSGRTKAVERFTAAAMASAFERLYGEILS
jgi:glycosyltransferase involved in cell wall biosynthesis